METPKPKCCTELIFLLGALAESCAEYKMLECSLSFSFPKVFLLARFRPVLLIIFYIFQRFIPLEPFFQDRVLSVVTAKWPRGRCSAFFPTKKRCKMLPLSFDNVTATPCMWQRSREKEMCGFFGEIHIFGVYILNNFQTTRDTRFGRMWFGPQLISGLGNGREKYGGENEWDENDFGRKGRCILRCILRSSKDLVTEETPRYAHKIRTNQLEGEHTTCLSLVQEQLPLIRAIPLMKYWGNQAVFKWQQEEVARPEDVRDHLQGLSPGAVRTHEI